MDARTFNHNQQARGIADALREQLRRRTDGQEAAPEEAPTPPLSVWHHVVEMNSRWAITDQPFTSRMPVIGPMLARVRNAAKQLIIKGILQQQVDFNASTVRFAQRVDRELADLSATVHGMAQTLSQTFDNLTETVAERDRAQVDFQREQAAMRVLLRYQQSRLAEAERQITALSQENKLLLRRAEQERRPPAAASAAGPAPEGARPAIDYYRFELRFRGTSDSVLEHQRQYVPCFAGASDVLDIGCGRGEFLQLLLEAGVSCRGVDLDTDMVAACHAQGLDVTEGDALAYLRAQADGSLGGAFTAQLVEHLEPAVMVEMVNLLGEKLRPGAPVVIETINPLCLLAASSHFLLDLSHVRLVHPETLRFLLECAGFSQVDVRYTSPVPPELQLERMPWPDDGGPLDALTVVHDRNMEKINSFLYGYQDYAVIARKD